MNQKKVAGIGIYTPGKFVSYQNGTTTEEYKVWQGMLKRCQPNGPAQKRQPAYIGCAVHPSFIHFQDFAEWCQNQIGFGVPGWQLDKDILRPGNKEYGPDTCCFVPPDINKLFNQNLAHASPYPVGVTFCNYTRRYMATIKTDGVKKFLGRFDTVTEAETAYQTAKRQHVEAMAVRWAGLVDPRVITAILAKCS